MARAYLAALIALFALATLPGYAATPEPKAPSWQQLPNEQRDVLAVLAPQWDQMPDQQRHKLIAVAKRYPKMNPKEQAHIKARLGEWATLSRQERELARERYRKLKQLPPEKRKEVKKKWETYKAQKKPTGQTWNQTDQSQPYITGQEPQPAE